MVPSRKLSSPFHQGSSAPPFHMASPRQSILPSLNTFKSTLDIIPHDPWFQEKQQREELLTADATEDIHAREQDGRGASNLVVWKLIEQCSLSILFSAIVISM